MSWRGVRVIFQPFVDKSANFFFTFLEADPGEFPIHPRHAGVEHAYFGDLNSNQVAGPYVGLDFDQCAAGGDISNLERCIGIRRMKNPF